MKTVSNIPNKQSKLLFPELSYQIVGLLFDVHKKLGGGYQEKHYQRAIEKLLQRDKIKYSKELKADLSFEGDNIGKFFLDFLIENKVVLELKTVPRLLPEHFRQVRSYLKVNNLELGILANFRGEKLVFKRVLNLLDSD